jgi:hypothetical protein
MDTIKYIIEIVLLLLKRAIGREKVKEKKKKEIMEASSDAGKRKDLSDIISAHDDAHRM